MNTALLLLRVVVGAFFLGHGSQKLFGAFGGKGLKGTAEVFESLNFKPGSTYALVGGLSETISGLLFIFGLFVPVAAALMIAMMINAIGSVHAAKGLWVDRGGAEYPLILITIATALTLSGPGHFSLDRLIEDSGGIRMSGTIWAVVVLAVAGMASFVTLASRKTGVMGTALVHHAMSSRKKVASGEMQTKQRHIRRRRSRRAASGSH